MSKDIYKQLKESFIKCIMEGLEDENWNDFEEVPNKVVYLYPGAGASLVPVEVKADSEEEALEKAVAKYGEGPCIITTEQFEDLVREEANDQGLNYDELRDKQDWETIEKLENSVGDNYIYVDATMEGGDCCYVDGNYLRIEDLPQPEKKTIGQEVIDKI